MNLLNRIKLPAIAGILLVVGFLSSCEQDLTTLGDGVIGGEPFVTDKVVYDVIAFNKKIEAVQTNRLPIYQLGVFNDPVFGKTTASITSQVQLSAYNPRFGDSIQSSEVSSNVFENETIDSVFIYIPYLNNKQDTDGDGVVDELDDLPEDPTNDSDNDNVPNNQEVANNTDPLVQDTDGDGENDDVDESTLGSRFAERFRLDSIYGDRTKPFNLKVERSTFFLRDLDPSTNFEESQEYFSSQEFAPTFTEEVFFDGAATISDEEILFIVEEDDPDTEEDEEGTVSSKLDPGIRVKLNTVGATFFQENILDKEGSSELQSASNFKEFFKGVHLSLTPSDQELLMLLDITNAHFDVFYSFDDKVDDTIERNQENFRINLITGSGVATLGNAVNTFVNDAYPASITDAMDTQENASKIYLKGGAGSFAEIRLFDEDFETAKTLINEIKTKNWIINEANLVFYVDTESVPASSIEPPRLYLYNAETNNPLYNSATESSISDTALGSFQNYDGFLEQSSDSRGIKYTIKITEYLNEIIVRDLENTALGLAVSPDIRITGANSAMLANGTEQEIPASGTLSPLGTVLFGNDLPEGDANKLKLEIFYTETN
ncbi:MAG: DUF4270 family protein [Maribacter sp.]